MARILRITVLIFLCLLGSSAFAATPNVNVYNWDGSLERLNQAINQVSKNNISGKPESFSLGSVNDKSVAVIDIHNFTEDAAAVYLETATKINDAQVVAERRRQMLTNLNYIQPHFVISNQGIVLKVR